MTDARPLTLAERKRQLVLEELTSAALQLLAAKGFDAATIDEIVAAAGVSRRTFFRYFRSKEDVVVQLLATLNVSMVVELAGRPLDEPPSVALRHAIGVAVDDCAGHPEKALPIIGLILNTPALLARALERQEEWADDLARGLADRLGLDPAAGMYPRLAAQMALAAFGETLRRWTASGGAADARQITDEAFAVIAPALDAAPSGPQ